jgi:hypothetical protein
MADQRSPFDFGGQSSSFVKDARFVARKNGKSQSQIAAQTVERLTALHGSNPGKIVGLSRRDRPSRAKPAQGKALPR